MKTHLLHIINSDFARNVAVVAMGTAASQAIALSFAPIITRLYGPEALGVLGVFIAMISVLGPISALTYPTAIILPKADPDANILAWLSFYLALSVSLLTTAIFLLTGNFLLNFFGSGTISPYVLLIPIFMLFTSLLQISQQLLYRKKRFKIVAKAFIAQALIVNCAKAGLGWLNPSAVMLILISTAGEVVHFAMLALGMKNTQKARSRIDNNVSQSTLLELAKRYNDFPFYRAPQVFINSISQGLPVLMLASSSGPISAGYYAISKTVLEAPSTLIGKSFGDVFYPRISEASRSGSSLTQIIRNATVSLILIGLLPFILVIIFGPWLFGFIFGSNWVMAGEYAQWLAPFFFFNFINKPTVASVPVLGIQKGLLIYEILSASVKAIGLLIGCYAFGSDMVAIALFSLSGVTAYIILILWIISCARLRDNNAKASKSRTL